MTALVVSEVFGPTIQGEGPSSGRRCAFVRLGRCNLTCGGPGPATWACDTPYTWDWKGQNGQVYDPAVELRSEEASAVVARLDGMGVDMVVISGGEPMLQRLGLGELARLCADRGWRVEIETNGTQRPWPGLAPVTQFNVSPKLANSGVDREKRIVPAALQALQVDGRAVWKFVCSSADDLEEVDRDFALPFGLSPIYVMPAGTQADAVLDIGRGLADAVVARGWNLTSRLHVVLWGDKRGV